jgi:3-hydroxymyristoyl/3-hydroxydecanoyl-(acyl carrier protein) dehydratase
MILTSTPITDEEIFKIIDVNKPYFALQNLTYHSDGTVTAIIPIEQHLGYEPTPITSSESGRHLAVLGSCVCALNNPNKTRHYYLAASANATRKDFDFFGEKPGYFIGWAKCLKVEGKLAQAQTMLKFPDGRIYSEIVINYHMLNHRIFERINQSRLIKILEQDYNPYISDPEIKYEKVSDTRIISTVDNISPMDCAGHFPEIPAVPIAILFRILVKLSIILMQIRKGNPSQIFCVKECTTEAKNLAFPGEPIDIETQFIYTDENNFHYIRTMAYTNCNCCVGVIDIILFEVNL